MMCQIETVQLGFCISNWLCVAVLRTGGTTAAHDLHKMEREINLTQLQAMKAAFDVRLKYSSGQG